MDRTTQRRAPFLRAAGIALAVTVAALAPLVTAGPAMAAAAPPPQLSIGVDDGRASATAGDTLGSTITIRNLGTVDVAGLTVTQSVPAGAVFATADSAGVAHDGNIAWTVDVAAAGAAVLRSTMTVSATPPQLLRLATVACARSSAATAPIVCASDSDQLPAGALADRAAAAPDGIVWWIVAGGAGLLVVAAVVTATAVRRRRRRIHRAARVSVGAALLVVVMIGTGASAAVHEAVADPAADSVADVAQAATVNAPPGPRHRDAAVDLPDPAAVPGPRPDRAVDRPAAVTTALPTARAAVAVAAAMAQIGLPYVWGGNGPEAGDAGFDCSGLTTFSYAVAGVQLPRTAQTQFYAGPNLSGTTALEPGDLVFYGTLLDVHHVGMYIGQGRMINAPTFGEPVQTAYYRWGGDDYLGATRPAATGQPTTGSLVYAPPSGDPGVGRTTPSTAFLAPPAPLPAPAPVAALLATPLVTAPPAAAPAVTAAPAPLTEAIPPTTAAPPESLEPTASTSAGASPTPVPPTTAASAAPTPKLPVAPVPTPTPTATPTPRPPLPTPADRVVPCLPGRPSAVAHWAAGVRVQGCTPPTGSASPLPPLPATAG